tara:strand:+ start:2775 stop:3605 length:831 start_codon:yes stop_codon:yes gene_type:complete
VIAYLRVSTARQGASGLGLEAQRAAIKAYAERKGEEILEEHVEVETGTSKRYRPALAMALKSAKRLGVTLVTAKLDRLARSVAAVCAIQQSGVKFIALDLPETENPLFLYVIAALAEYEARLISERTKAALAAKRARGWVPGKYSVWKPGHRERGPFTRWAQAVARDQDVAGYIGLLSETGHTQQQIAVRLNEEGKVTTTGCQWCHQQVGRVLRRRRETLQGVEGRIAQHRRATKRLRVERLRANAEEKAQKASIKYHEAKRARLAQEERDARDQG